MPNNQIEIRKVKLGYNNGSNPATPTKKIKALTKVRAFLFTCRFESQHLLE